MRVEDIAVSQGSACPERFEGFRDIEPGMRGAPAV